MKSSSKQLLPRTKFTKYSVVQANTVLHSFSWRCLLVLTFFFLMTQQSIIIAELYNVSYCNFERFELLQCDERASQKQKRGAHNFENAIFIEKCCMENFFFSNMYLFFDIVIQRLAHVHRGVLMIYLKVSKSRKQNTKFSHTTKKTTKFCTFFCPSL
jgi:hypothetical protein